MKIDPRIQSLVGSQPERVKNAGNGKAKSDGSANSSGISSTLGEDTVKLSSTHGDVQTLAAGLAQVPEVRTDRVQALQQQVRNGSYSPDSQKVADAMIKEHGQLNVKA